MEKIINRLQKLEEFVSQNDLSDVATLLKSENGVDKVEDLQKTLLEQEKQDRVLRIGILGRVKAGKSSFLNALVFDGNDILPKAATPMTAALTILEYGESTSAEVDFYTEEDLKGIKNEHQQFLDSIEKITAQRMEEFKESREKARSIAEQEVKNNERLFSSYDQYERILSSGISDVSQLNQYKKIQANNIDDLKNKLKDFIASDGRFMPFTKSVTLRLNNENLKDIQIIDTPGINDPVASRGERTKELLKDCDVCFLISPGGQFLSAEDMDLLNRLQVREGVQEFYIIASQIDMTLRQKSVIDNSYGALDIAMQNIQNDLSAQMNSALTQQKQKTAFMSESVSRRFDKLMEHPVICTSGMAFSIFRNWEKQSQWDESLSFNFDKLKRNYPDFFSNAEMAKGNLSKIANIEKIQELVEEVRAKKEEIQKSKKEDFLRVKNKGIEDCKSELLKHLKEDEKQIQEGNLEKIQKEKDAIMQAKDRGTKAVNDEYCIGVGEDLKLCLDRYFDESINDFFNKAQTGSKNAQDKKSVSHKVSTKTWWNPFSWFNDDEIQYSIHKTIEVGDVVSYTQEMINNLKSMFRVGVEEKVKEWKDKLSKNIGKAVRDEVGDKLIRLSMLDRTTRGITQAIQYPKISLPEFPQELRGSGKLEGWQAEEYIEKFDNFFHGYRSQIDELTQTYLSELIQELKKINLGDQVFGSLEKEIIRLESEIQNRQSNLDRYKRMIATLEAI